MIDDPRSVHDCSRAHASQGLDDDEHPVALFLLSNDFVIQISAHRYGSEVSIERFERKLEIGFDPRPSVRLISIDCRSPVV